MACRESLMTRKSFSRVACRTLILGQLCIPHASAQTPASDSQTRDANRSWTATTESQRPNTNPTRSTESHTKSGNRTVDKQTRERLGTDGHYQPYLDVEKETAQVNATTARTIERPFARGPSGEKTLMQVTEEEKQTLGSGDGKLVRTTSNRDMNGGLQVVLQV